ncbi:hypothetical protein [Bacillus massiliglaciei]|uniref:hypothetical protein n=1 Tax=Bacillus massiliglaciei TaxID=1816693 RepID=UPI0018FED939|nr:hypothetical protein [Bacillus massiliglaciei]
MGQAMSACNRALPQLVIAKQDVQWTSIMYPAVIFRGGSSRQKVGVNGYGE